MPKWICDMKTIDTTKTNDVAELTKLSTNLAEYFEKGIVK